MAIASRRGSWGLALGFGVLGLGLGWFGAIFGSLAGFVLGELIFRLWTPSRFGRIYAYPQKDAPFVMVEGCLGAGVLGFSGKSPSPSQVLGFTSFLRRRKIDSFEHEVLGRFFGFSLEQLVELAKNPCFQKSVDFRPLELLNELFSLGSDCPTGSTPELFRCMVALGEVWDVAPQRVQGVFLEGRWYPSIEGLGTLGLGIEADFPRVKKRYRELVSSFHPDTRPRVVPGTPNPDEEFVRVQEAYKLLEYQARLPLD